MRDVKVNERTLRVRGLTGREIRELKAQGIPVSRFGVNVQALLTDHDLAEKTMDAVFDRILTDEDRAAMDELANAEVLAVWKAAVKETWGARDEEKNS